MHPLNSFMRKAVLIFILALFAPFILAKGLYQEPVDFIAEVFQNEIPKPTALWISKKLKPEVKHIMGHDLPSLRVRYWGKDQRTAWILEEIGKEKLITVGVVVNQGKIEKLKVLIFRETRGYEVRHPFFTDQFQGRMLADNKRLDKPIDGISGATLSVRALRKIARLALFLHQHSKFAHGHS